MYDKLSRYLVKPELYAPSTGKFWDDEHISQGMLKAHLDPSQEAASRRHAFLDESAGWIARIAPPAQYGALLDLGCGPGLYAQRFARAGYAVTGIDFSKRSIDYAQEQAGINQSSIEYHYQNYLSIDYHEQFDVVTLIYCDYPALSASDRHALLGKVRNALRPGGRFLFDVFTPRKRSAESRSWQHHPQGGFFCAKPHLCLSSVYQYQDEDQTELRQSIIVTDDAVHCYHVWDHFFTKDSLLAELRMAGFHTVDLYGDVAGLAYSDDGETICAVVSR